MTTPTPDLPMTDAAFEELKANYARVTAESDRLWKLKNAATDAWFPVAEEEDRLKRLVEHEELKRKWMAELKASQAVAQP